MKNICVVGNITRDYLFRAKKLPELDEVSYIDSYNSCIGGRGGVVAMTLGELGAKVRIVTNLPYDKEGDSVKALFENNGISTQGISYKNNADMHRVNIYIGYKEENCISFFVPGKIDMSISPEQGEVIEASDIVYFTTHSRKFNTKAHKYIKDHPIIVYNVTNHMIDSEEYVDCIRSNAKILILNEAEGKKFVKKMGCEAIEELFAHIASLKCIFFTKGKKGSFLYERDKARCKIDSQDAKCISPVGAGDTYAAGILYGIANDWSLLACAKFATKLAAISVSSVNSYPDKEQVQLFVKGSAY